MSEDAYIESLKRQVDVELSLLRNRQYDEYERLIEQSYRDPLRRHAKYCKLLWEKGQRREALSEVIQKLKSGKYTIEHQLLAPEFAYRLRNRGAAAYLMNEFDAKYEEVSSLRLIAYVYRTLAGEPVSPDELEAAELLMGKS